MRLGEVCESVSQTFREQAEKVVLINTSDVLDGRVTNHSYVPNENLRGQFKKTFQLNDILYSEIRPRNRRFAFVDFDASGYVASTKLMVIRGNEKVLPEFLFQILKSDLVINQLQLMAESRSGTFPQITFSELAALDVSIPSIAEQREIAATLRAFDDKIANNTKINRHLEEMARAMFKHWFVDFGPWGGEIPINWTFGKAGDFFDISIGKTPPRKEPHWFSTNPQDVIWVSISDMSSCGVFIGDSSEYLTAESIAKFNIKIVPSGTVLLSFKLTVGRVAITNGEMTTNEAIAHFKRSDDTATEYLFCYLKAFDYQSLGNTSSIATAVNSKTIKAMSFVMPDEKVLREFHEATAPLFQQIRVNLEESARLATLRDILLPRLMSGELPVADPPAVK